MNVYAFIFARGGSKGLPGKNIRELHGIPLLGYSIKMAQSIECITKIFVSTDCDQIAAVGEHYGAHVIKRPSELATDTASEWKAWQHAINHVRGYGDSFDIFLSLPTTSPLRAKEDVAACLDALAVDTDMAITVTPSSRNPYFNMVTRSNDGTTCIVMGSAEIKRRQDAPSTFDITTVAYAARPDFILGSDSLFGGVVKSVIVPKERAVDIDDETDFRIAEALMGVSI
jgi:N-acylneuraminate cytidylyltransferase